MLFNFLTRYKKKDDSFSPSGIIYGAILHKEWLTKIMEGELAELEPWITPQGEISPVIGFQDKILKKLEIGESEYTPGKTFRLKTNKNIIGIYIDKDIIKKLQNKEIMFNNYPSISMNIATMTSEVYVDFIHKIKSISDEKGFLLISNNPKYDIQLVLPKGTLNRVRDKKNECLI